MKTILSCVEQPKNLKLDGNEIQTKQLTDNVFSKIMKQMKATQQQQKKTAFNTKKRSFLLIFMLFDCFFAESLIKRK